MQEDRTATGIGVGANENGHEAIGKGAGPKSIGQLYNSCCRRALASTGCVDSAQQDTATAQLSNIGFEVAARSEKRMVRESCDKGTILAISWSRCTRLARLTIADQILIDSSKLMRPCPL